ncbi:hypothetical protein Tco_0383438, partial [Tanacetum coccineum]
GNSVGVEEMVTDEDGYGSGGTRRLKMVDRDGDDEEMEMLRSVAGYKDTTVVDLQLLEDLLLSRG